MPTMGKPRRSAGGEEMIPPSSTFTTTTDATTTYGISKYHHNNNNELTLEEMNKRSSSSSTDSAATNIAEARDGAAANSSPSSASSFLVWIWMINSILSFFQAIRLVYIPLVFQSLMGGFHVLKFFLLGHLLDSNDMSTTPTPPAVRNVFSPLSMLFSTADKENAPPAEVASVLTCLALLLCVALAVHPDGFTWIAVRRLREMFMSTIHSSSTCWAHLMNDDTGIVSSVLALATFCALFFFCYVLHRTLAPKQPRNRTCSSSEESPPELTPVSDCCSTSTKPLNGPSSSSRKKKKKKNSKKRSGAAAAAALASPPTTTTAKQSASASGELSPKQNGTSDPSAEPQFTCCSQTTHAGAKQEQQQHKIPEDRIATVPECAKATVRPPPGLEKHSRSRVESPSTVDTTASSVFSEEDPLSLSSQHRPHPKKQQQQNRNNRSKQRANNKQRNGSNHPVLVVSSRWDALKPDTTTPRSSQTPQQRKGQGKNCTGASQQQQRSNHKVNNTATPHHSYQRKPSNVVRKEAAAELSTGSGLPSSISSGPSFAVSTPSRNRRPEQTSRNSHEPSVPVTPATAIETPSFFSDLNPQTPPFAPSSPCPPAIRPPPGLSLPMEEKNEDLNSFFLPPATNGSSCASVLPSNTMPASANFPMSRPSPGLMVPTGAAVPPGMEPISPIGFRPLVKENPFEEQENDAQIEAELQELGGRMIENLLE